MKVRVPPRPLASAAIATAVSRGGWAVAGATLLTTAIVLVDVLASAHRLAEVGVPAAALVVMAASLVLLAWRKTPSSAVTYLLVGAACSFVFQISLSHTDPALHERGVYLLNRPAVALALVGSLSLGVVPSVLWTVSGFLVGLAATIAADLSLGEGIVTGFGPAMVAVLYITVWIALGLIRRSQLARVPDVAEMELTMARMSAQRVLERDTVALVHETLLTDLGLVATNTRRLDERDRERFRADVRLLRSVMEGGFEALDDGPDRRDDIASVVAEFPWRGLAARITGDATVMDGLPSRTRAAVAGALRASLNNVLRHAQTTEAQVLVDSDGRTFTLMIVDRGRGFDPAAVPANRLGIRVALTERIESVGGQVVVRSAVGVGTSVLITVPIGAERHGEG